MQMVFKILHHLGSITKSIEKFILAVVQLELQQKSFNI